MHTIYILHGMALHVLHFRHTHIHTHPFVVVFVCVLCLVVLKMEVRLLFALHL